jgi:hypothetical protein
LKDISNNGRIVNEELSSYIQTQLQTNNITGLSLGIILPNGEVEFEVWGNRTEDGDPVTPEVCFRLFLQAINLDVATTDHHEPGIMLEGERTL